MRRSTSDPLLPEPSVLFMFHTEASHRGRSPQAPLAFALLAGLLALCLGAEPSSAQTAFLDFNIAGQYTNNFNPWNNSGGVNGGNYSFRESSTGGIGNSGCISVFQS